MNGLRVDRIKEDWVPAIKKQRLSGGKHVYFAYHPQWPGCNSHGDTKEEAIENWRDAHELYRKDNCVIDVPNHVYMHITLTDDFRSDISVPEFQFSTSSMAISTPKILDKESVLA